MVPIIRGRRSPPRLGDGRDANLPPGLLQTSIISESQINASLVDDRAIVYLEDFAAGWEEFPNGRIPWRIDPVKPQPPLNEPGAGFNADVQSWELTTLNGAPAVAATWNATRFGDPDGGKGTGDERFGDQIRPPAMAAGLDEAWFTWEMMFSDPFSAPRGGKLPGLAALPASTGGNPVTCAAPTWSARHMFNTQIPDSGPAPGVPGGVQKGHQYLYHQDEIQDRRNYTMPFPLNELLIMEQYLKLNDDGQANGINITKINGVVFLASTNLRFYCTDNRDDALIRNIIFNMLWGGNTHDWDPLFDSTLTFGRFKVEVPT